MKKMSSAVVLSIAGATTLFGASLVLASEDGAAGVGDLTCATYVKMYDGYDTDRRKFLDQKVEQWALGYMSGLNKSAGSGTKRDLSSLNDVGYRIVSDCRMSANMRIVDIAMQIYEIAPMAEPGTA